jgi:hypothetical protein
MQRVVSKIEALDNTGDVVRGRARPVDAEALSAVSVYQGTDAPISEQYPLVTSELQVTIELQVKASLENVETLLNEIREDINLALLADSPPLELDYCVDIFERSASPDVNALGERRAGVAIVEYTIQYRRTRANPGV